MYIMYNLINIHDVLMNKVLPGYRWLCSDSLDSRESVDILPPSPHDDPREWGWQDELLPLLSMSNFRTLRLSAEDDAD